LIFNQYVFSSRSLVIRPFHFLAAVIILFSNLQESTAQVIASGKVYDAAAHVIMPGVSIIVLHRNEGMQSDDHGRYYLHVKAGDTLQFSFVGYTSRKLFVPGGNEFFSEDVYLTEKDLDLPEVNIKGFRSYRQDSVDNRKFNATIFNYRQPSATSKVLGSILSPYGIHMPYHRARHGNSLSRFQDKLVEEEQARFVDYKFNQQLVRSITGLAEPQLSDFMHKYRPSYEFVSSVSEYDFLEQIMTDCRSYLRE